MVGYLMTMRMFEVVPFETVKEDWSVYKLRDGSTVRIRYILIKVLKRAQLDVFGNPTYDLNYGTVAGVIADPSLLGPPSPRASPEVLNKSIVEKDIGFDPVTEPWNEYRVENNIMKVKLVLTKVARTSIFDEHGEPSYLLNSQPITTSEG